jgi:hypothetical protein
MQGGLAGFLLRLGGDVAVAAEQLETLRDAASAAILAADYATALATVERMAVILAGTPDLEMPNGVKQEWGRKIDTLFGQLSGRRNAATGIQRTKTVWAQPSAAS